MNSRSHKVIVLSFLLGSSSAAMAVDFLDNMIWSAKCSGSSNPEQCKESAKREYEDMRKRQAAGGNVTPGSKGTVVASNRRTCRNLSKHGDVDVDVAYARAMKKFGFMTENQRREIQNGMLQDDFRHEVVPGARYVLADLVGLNSFEFWSRVELSKAPQGKTDLDARYCVPEGTPAKTTNEIETALNGLVDNK